nr:hypothetical protein [Tanacetum cinerariifolium]
DLRFGSGDRLMVAMVIGVRIGDGGHLVGEVLWCRDLVMVGGVEIW